MKDITKTVIPNSSQLNSDDLLAGPKTIAITDIKLKSGDQPVAVHYEGDDGKPYLPCKSMRRVLVHAWGKNGEDYAGRKLTLYNDPSVRWAGTEYGGIRISHMSDIEKQFTMMLTQSRGKRSPFTVKPLITAPLNALTDEAFESFSSRIAGCDNMADLGEIGKEIKAARLDKDGSARITVVYREMMTKIREGE